MQKDNTNRLIYSASDLVNFTLCPSITLYDLQHLQTPLEKAEEDPFAQILQEKGIAHETRYLDRLKKNGRTVADIAALAGGSIPELVEKTVAAMSDGADVIFQACLQVENRIGHIDFLEKVDKPSRSGRHAYEVTDTKLPRKAAPKHVIQLCFYAELLEHFQGTLPEKVRVPGMHALTLQTLREQASLQLKKRETGQHIYQLLPVEPETVRGFNRLPAPDPGDLYFDMEGNPLEDDGLEYLFGIYFHDNGPPVFKDFWAHDKKQEKTTFEAFIDFVWNHLKKHPAAHIYHYGHYEETALKHLMSEHGTREFQVDQLLRHHTLVDLYKVVRQGLRISESSYSLKQVEHFYMENRDADVVNAVESVIVYEKWKLTRDPAILDAIRDYNEEDCRSTFLLHTWLLSIKPSSAACFFDQPAESVEDTPPDSAITEHEQALVQMRGALP
jgi:predicted RecB family nuclease